MKLLLLLFMAIKIKQIKTHSIKITLLHLVLIFAIKKEDILLFEKSINNLI